MERLQKLLSRAGVASRRASETLILDGRVSVDGEVVTALGTKADPAHSEIAVDGKPWKPVFPADGIPDMPMERVDIALQDLDQGEHVIVLRAYDLAGNPGTGRVIFEVP